MTDFGKQVVSLVLGAYDKSADISEVKLKGIYNIYLSLCLRAVCKLQEGCLHNCCSSAQRCISSFGEKNQDAQKAQRDADFKQTKQYNHV